MRKIAYIDDFDKWKESFSFYTEIPIRFSETDMFGHVNNVSAFIYFEQARIDYLKEIGIFTGETDQSQIPVVADLQCDYIQQLYFGETLKLFVKANSVGGSSVDLHYMGLNGKGDVCLTGRGRLVTIDVNTGRPVKISEEQRAKFLSE